MEFFSWKPAYRLVLFKVNSIRDWNALFNYTTGNSSRLAVFKEKKSEVVNTPKVLSEY